MISPRLGDYDSRDISVTNAAIAANSSTVTWLEQHG